MNINEKNTKQIISDYMLLTLEGLCSLMLMIIISMVDIVCNIGKG